MSKKICTKCKEEKKLEAFHTNPSIKSGYDYWCRLCRNLYVKEHRKVWREANLARREKLAKKV